MITLLAKKYAGRALRKHLQKEYADWLASGDDAGDFLEQRFASLSRFAGGAEMGGLVTLTHRGKAILSGIVDGRRRFESDEDKETHLQSLAQRERERLAAMEERMESLASRAEEVEALEGRAQDKVQELIDRARLEATQRVETARQRLTEIEELAALHVAEVERKARLTEKAIVSSARADLARDESRWSSELERTRVDARAATERAQAARRVTGVTDDSETVRAETPSPAGDSNTSSPTSFARSLRSRAQQSITYVRPPSEAASPADLGEVELSAMDWDALYGLARLYEIDGRSEMTTSELAHALSRLSPSAG